MKAQAIKALDLFKDNTNVGFAEYIKKDGFIYATDGYKAIKISEQLIPNVEAVEKKDMDLDAVFKPSTTNEILAVNKTFFENFKTEDEYIDVEKSCDECEGVGEVYWEYKRWDRRDECPSCDGSGTELYRSPTPTGNKIYPPKLRVKLKDSIFNFNVFHSLLKVQEIVNEPIYLKNSTKPNRASIFRIGKFDIALMPVPPCLHLEKENIVDLNDKLKPETMKPMTKQEKFEKKQEQMTNEELYDLVNIELSKICNTLDEFTLSVPPRVDDTDMLISELLRRFQKLTNCKNNKEL